VIGGGVVACNALHRDRDGADVFVLSHRFSIDRLLLARRDLQLALLDRWYSDHGCGGRMILLPARDLDHRRRAGHGLELRTYHPSVPANLLKPGAVMVDVAIDQGGCFETSDPTTHHEPTF